jgi:hypothetical protein
MPVLYIVGGGLFGSQAAAYARHKGIEAVVFDPGLAGGASPAAAGLFKETWAGKKLHEHYQRALPLLEKLYGIRGVPLVRDDGEIEWFQCVPPTVILDANPVRQTVTAVGDGWLEADGRRYEGWIYVAAGVWSGAFLQGLDVIGKAGSSFLFGGERAGRIHEIERGRQAIAFEREPGCTFFSDGTAEIEYMQEHDRLTLARAAKLGLTAAPMTRMWGRRPYTRGGVLFQKMGARTWLATGGRKMGTILGASLARRLVEEELR